MKRSRLRDAASLGLALAALGKTTARAQQIRFEEISVATGASYVHHVRKFAPPYADVLGMFTSGGAAVAIADYDRDGDEDVFLTDSAEGTGCHLLRNDLDKQGHLHFTDVTAAAGITRGNEPHQIVSDALWFDADNDGWPDLLIARFGTPLLYRNLGNGRFEDVTAGSGLDQFANTIAVIAFDYDNDGRVDLLFGNYFKPEDLTALKDRHVLPDNLDQATNGGGVTLWRNVTEPGSHQIRFVDVTKAAGLGDHHGWTLDVGHGDFDGDGYEDLYLADDYGTDRLFLNQRNGTFKDVTREALGGYDTKKGMNVEVGDYDHDGRLDIYVTNITDDYMRECNMLWHNNGLDAQGHLTFTDVARETGTCNTLWGWGAKFGDFDDDGWEDLFVVDGLRSAGKGEYVTVMLDMLVKPGVDFTDVASYPPIGDRSWSGYQRKKLFRNLGGQLFKEVAAAAGVDNDRDGRGVGIADFDNDGRLDILQTNAGQATLLYHNVSPAAHWLELRLVGTRSNRDAIGARVTVRAGGMTWLREVDGGNGYASQSSRRVHVGLGAATKVDSVEVRWPSGLVEVFHPAIDAITTYSEGSGEARH
jgi:hypothetical protein